MQKTAAERQLERHIPALVSLWRESGGNKGRAGAHGKQGASLSPEEYRSVADALLSLQRGLTGSRELAGAGYMENRAFLGAYLLYYWCVSYLQVSYAARSAREQCRALVAARNESGAPLRILDAGSGPAPASMALCDLLDELGAAAASELLLWDSSGKALALAQKLYEREFPGISPQCTVTDFQHDALPSSGTQDIIVMSHALNELWKEEKLTVERRTAFVEELCGGLADDGLLLLCEPALLATSRNLIRLRDALLRRGFHVLSPCPASAACPAIPAGENQTCHAELAWQPPDPVKSLAKAARLDRNSVKMTFFVFSRKVPPAECGGAYRVVSDAMLNKAGRLRYLLCDGTRRMALSAKKGDPHAAAQGFFDLRRYDRVQLQQAEQRGGDTPAYGITDTTSMQVQAFKQ